MARLGTYVTLFGVVAPLAFVGCSDEGYSVVVRFDPHDAAQHAERIEVAFVNDCSSSPSMTDPINGAALTVEVRRSGSVQGLGDLEEGRYGLYGRATSDCGLTAMGCSDVEILSDGGELLLELVVTDFGTCQTCEGPDCPCEGDGDCPPDSACVAGECICQEDCPCEDDDDCTPPTTCVDGDCVCDGECPCIEDRDCERNMTCSDGDCVCIEWYLNCDGFEDNGCERLGISCSPGNVNCSDSFDCYLGCDEDSECIIGCYGECCEFLLVYNLVSCRRDNCLAECNVAPMSSSCRSCLRAHCDSRLNSCLDTEC